MHRLLIILGVSFTVFSCLEVNDPVNDNYVVEGFIYTGETVNDIKIKTLISLGDANGESGIINHAEVILTKNSLDYPLIFNNQTKKYEYNGPDLMINIADEIHLQVTVEDRISSAITKVPTSPENITVSKTQMIIPEINGPADFIGNDPLADAEILLNWDNPYHELHYVVIEFRSNLLRPILPSSIQEVVDGILEDFAIITPPDTISNYTISGALLPSYGPYVAKVYKVNQEYADLFESEEQDSRDLNDPPSNIINARGIFTAFSSDSLSFEIIKP